MDHLMASLLDFLHEVEGQSIPILVGGGFGLYLKREHLVRTKQRMLFDDRLPGERSTQDLDLFLRVEVLADHGRTKAVAEAIRRLGYAPVPTARFMQWVKEVSVNGFPQPVKIDMLVGPLGSHVTELNADERRARPKQKIEFHARRTEEAICIEDDPIIVTISGNRSLGSSHTATIHIPQAFPYLMMKLHAFDDRKNDADKDMGRHHALDLYTIVGMMTEMEYERAKDLGVAHAADHRVKRACAIVQQDFADTTALGVLRLREHTLFRDAFLLDQFISVLREVFPNG